MKIKTRIQFVIIFSFLLALTAGTILFFTTRTINKVSSELGIAAELATGVAELKIVTNEYLLHHEARALMQWRSRYDSLLKLLRGGHFQNPDEQIFIDGILKNLKRFKSVFFYIFTDLKKGETFDKQETIAFQELQDRLMAELLVQSQLAVSLAFQLHQKIEIKLMTTQKRASLLTILILLILTVFIAGISLWVNRSIGKPIVKLEEGTRIIGRGNLDHKVGTTTKDEVGHLSRAIDKMTEDLKETTASIAELNKEIDERKRAEGIIDKFFEQSMNLNLISGLDGLIHRVNKGWQTFLGYAKEELEGKNFLDLVHPNDQAVTIKEMSNLSKGKSTLYFENRYRHKNGEYRLLAWSAIASVEERLIYSVASDITEKKILEAEAMRAGHLASLGELAAGVAHEINNPITGIIGYAEILTDEFSERGEAAEIPSRIIKEGERIAKIVKNLLAFARNRKDEYSPASIQDIFLDIFSLVEKQIIKDGIKLNVDVSPDLPKIKAHSEEIQQVFLNIISNARYALNKKFPESHEDKVFEIKGETLTIKDRKHIRMIFYDCGIGISADILDKIYDPFFSTKPKNEGTGLGLSISHGIIKNHGGNLWFESVEGEYTKVMVDLPLDNG